MEEDFFLPVQPVLSLLGKKMHVLGVICFTEYFFGKLPLYNIQVAMDWLRKHNRLNSKEDYFAVQTA
jgi:hypothetical protein